MPVPTRKLAVRKNILDDVPLFMKHLHHLAMLQHNLNVFNFHCDHVCYRTETVEEYLEARHFLLHECACTILLESMINDRPISLLTLPSPIWYGRCEEGFRRGVSLVELPCPTNKRAYRKGWQHAEFVIKPHSSRFRDKTLKPDFLDDRIILNFRDKYARVKMKYNKKDINSDLELLLCNKTGASIKFHAAALQDVVGYEIENDMVETVPQNFFHRKLFPVKQSRL